MQPQDKLWIQLLFDEELEQKIVEVWNNLGRYLPEQNRGSKPHLSVLPTKISVDDYEATAAEIRAICGNFTSFPVRFDSLGCFCSQYNKDNSNMVFQLTPTLVPFAEHAIPLTQRIHQSWKTIDPHYSPTCWAPHCTLLWQMNEEEFKAEFSRVVDNIKLPFVGEVTRIGLFDPFSKYFLFISDLKKTNQ